MKRSNKTSLEKRFSYIYYDSDGRKTELIPGENGVTEVIIQTLHNLDDYEYDVNRKETRKHESLDCENDKVELIADPNVDLEQAVILEEEQKEIIALVHRAVSLLKPQQQELIKELYLTENPISYSDYAKKHGIEESTVYQKVWRTKSKLKEIIERIKK